MFESPTVTVVVVSTTIFTVVSLVAIRLSNLWDDLEAAEEDEAAHKHRTRAQIRKYKNKTAVKIIHSDEEEK
jgi:hypothetical protein